MLFALLLMTSAVEHPTSLPAGLAKAFKPKGEIVDIIRFEESGDKGSDHVVFVVLETTSNGVAIRGYHFVSWHFQALLNLGGEPKEKWEQLWMTQDGVFDCELDRVARYLPKTLDATDLDNNGKFETFFAYETACHGDVSPTSIKLLMHEREKKYAIRGRSKVVVDDKGKTEGGDSTPDDSFKSAPPAFLKEAKKRFAAALVSAQAP